MRKLTKILRWTFCVPLFCSTAAAASEVMPNMVGTEAVTSLIRETAFDTTLFFRSHHWDRSNIGVLYTGDDYGWPVYAFAIAPGCMNENEPVAICHLGMSARMLRVVYSDDQRPRNAAARLVRQMADAGADTPEKLRDAMDNVELQWLEANLLTCPGALEQLKRAEEVAWVPAEVLVPPDINGQVPPLVLHADKVTVTFRKKLWNATFSGWTGDSSPAKWAVEMAQTLEPCWQSSSSPVPWRR